MTQLEGLHPLKPIMACIELPEIGTILTTYTLTCKKMQLRVDLTRLPPTVPEDAASLMHYNSLVADDSPDDCIVVLVTSRFGDSQLCYDVSSQRFRADK